MGTENESPEPDCQKQFQAAVSVIQNLPKNGSYRPSYEEMLRFYSYYKQATMGPCLVPRPGFWDPIGRYKWDAWNSLGKMSREEAMSAYITEMKLVAQKVIDTVPLGEVAEDMFGYFEPLYQVIPDMPRPPETFLRRVTGWKEQAVNGDAGAVSESPCLPKELAPPSPVSPNRCLAQGTPLLSLHSLPLGSNSTNPSSESHPPRDLDSEVFCDSLEQLEPEPVWAAPQGAPGGEHDPRNSPVPPREKGPPRSLHPLQVLSKASRMGVLARLSHLQLHGLWNPLFGKSQKTRGCGAACRGPRNWTRGCWRQFEHYRRACRRCRGGCKAWRACPSPRSRGHSPGPVLGHGPLGSRVLRCSSSSCGPSLSSGSSECFGPKRGDCQWRGLCSQLILSWCALSLPRL
uniref:Acyl-CoA binding domain containing 4 n=1 Tax=Callithrix jacchus TaxID=9483 RepID=F7I6I0_CALJA